MAEFKLAHFDTPPVTYQQQVCELFPHIDGHYLSTLLWQRQISELDLHSYLQYQSYQPTSAAAFGKEIELAIERLLLARQEQYPIAIWGDFDADGITATSVLWDGLRQFFLPANLSYYIPDRLTESHGLNIPGLDRLQQQGVKLIITCDTGSTNQAEIAYAQSIGIDTIVTDHHTLPAERPPVVAIINPRYLNTDHPLYHLSGVAVAYKLIEALYTALPTVPTEPIEYLHDLVAIGLVADLVQLSGECRYLAQIGIARLQLQSTKNPELPGHRPGVAKLLELCRKTGDRPMDISFGIAPRINAISRIYGDARLGVNLLTSKDPELCDDLATKTEQANARRKEVQKEVVAAVQQRVQSLDLSTTGTIVLADPNWPGGVLGLVAGQIAQEYGRPTILLNNAPTAADSPVLARGSARSTQNIDLYQLVKSQAHLLKGFGGHPFAAGLSLLDADLPMFVEGIDRQLRQTVGDLPVPTVQIDLVVTIAELGKELFDELRLLEPCGMGNPVPKLLVANCRLENPINRNIKDLQGRTVRYLKTDVQMIDATGSCTAVWWGKKVEEVPTVPCDVLVELDFNSYKKRYEARIVDLRPTVVIDSTANPQPEILDFRSGLSLENLPLLDEIRWVRQCPRSWDELLLEYEAATINHQKLALTYQAPQTRESLEIFQRLIGIAKFLARTGQALALKDLQSKLGVTARSTRDALDCLDEIGFEVTMLPIHQEFQVKLLDAPFLTGVELENIEIVQQFLTGVAEDLFVEQYFWQVPVELLRSIGATHHGGLSNSEDTPEPITQVAKGIS
jgi:single-stranded-DNA-specific exonuclease